MKNYMTIIIMLFSSVIVVAQSSSDVGKIALSVVMPENVDGLNVSQLSKLETKITQIVSNTGLSANGYNNNFVIYPKFAIYETEVVEGGMQNITLITCELSIFIKQVDNNIIFSTISKTLRGSGTNKSNAITNAIAKTPVNDIDLMRFVETGKKKIKAYYELKCGDIISRSESLTKMQDFEQALGLLMTIPEEVSCYNLVQSKSVEIYRAYQSQKCNMQLLEAKKEFSSSNYNNSLELLSQIDPSTPCFKETQSLINNITSKVDAEKKKQWELKMMMYNDNLALEKQRMENIKDIAVEYYRSKPTNVSYTYLIR